MRSWWPDAAIEELTTQEFDHITSEIEEGIATGHDDALEQLFQRIKSPKPTVVRNPGRESLVAHPRLVFLHGYWHARRQGIDLPLSSTIDPIDLFPALGYIMLLHPLDHGQDFFYRVYGTEIARQSRIEMTGRRVRDVPVASVAAYFLATYRAAFKLKEPIFTHHTTHCSIQSAEWHRLILPFSDNTGAVDRLLVGNIPNARSSTG